MSQIVWLIGGSSGIGLKLVKLYLKQNNKVIVSSRDAKSSQSLMQLSKEYPQSLHFVDMDVSSTESIIKNTKLAWNIYSGIDLCLYNAGVYESMKVAEWDLEHFEAMNQVNYLGALRVLTQLTPLFKEQKHGHIAFNISISSYFGLPYGGGYSAPKAALLNFCESIQPELELINVKIQVINHGFVKTRLTAKNDFEMPQLLEPEDAAQKIYDGLTKTNNFEIKFPWALTSFLHFLRVIPYSLAFAITKKAL